MAKDGKRKILRVGIIQSGRIVEERLIRKREDVSVGQASKNTFILPAPQLPKSFTLFEAKAGKYQLVFDDSMEGRVSIGDQVLDLRSLAKSGSTKRRGTRSYVDLDDRSRGKVVVGDFTLLFQFIDAPPVLPKPQLPAAARGGLTQRIEWVFVNILLLCGLVLGGSGIGLDIWWRQTGQYLQEQYGQKTRAYELLKAEVVREQEEPEPEPEPEPDDEKEAEVEGEAPEAPPEPEPVKKPVKAAPAKKAEAKADEPSGPRVTQRSRAEVAAAVKSKTWLHAIGSESDGDGVFGPNTLKDGVATAKLDAAFQDSDGGVATAEAGTKATFAGQPAAVKTNASGYKKVSKTETGGSRIETKTVKSTTKEAASGGEVKIRANVGGSLGSASGVGNIDKSGVQAVFSRRKSAVKSCYEAALKKNEKVGGKIVIKFTIGTAGRITVISVTTNATGDSSLAQCIMNKVKQWKFPAPEGGAVQFSFPFVLSAG